MVDIPFFFNDLFSSDSTVGLWPYDEEGSIRCRKEGSDYIWTVTDESPEFVDGEIGQFLPGTPVYEIRVTRIA